MTLQTSPAGAIIKQKEFVITSDGKMVSRKQLFISDVIIHLTETNADPLQVITHLKCQIIVVLNGGSGSRMELKTGATRCWIYIFY